VDRNFEAQSHGAEKRGGESAWEEDRSQTGHHCSARTLKGKYASSPSGRRRIAPRTERDVAGGSNPLKRPRSHREGAESVAKPRTLRVGGIGGGPVMESEAHEGKAGRLTTPFLGGEVLGAKIPGVLWKPIRGFRQFWRGAKQQRRSNAKVANGRGWAPGARVVSAGYRSDAHGRFASAVCAEGNTNPMRDGARKRAGHGARSWSVRGASAGASQTLKRRALPAR
jgi:hypothetical protein